MQRVYRYIAKVIVLLLLLAGCSLKTVHLNEEKINDYLLKAAFLESEGNFFFSAQYYKKLFELTNEKIFLKKAIKNLFRSQKLDKAIELTEVGIKMYPKEKEFYQLLASLYIAKSDLERAKRVLLDSLKIRKDAKDFEMLGSIALLEKNYELALKYYKSAYAIKPSSKIVNSIAYIMYFYLDKKAEAIAYLETHIRIYGCDKEVCKTLTSLYGLQNDIAGLISVYKRLYATYKEEKYLRKLIDFYIYVKDFDHAIKWAQKSEDKKLLLDLYRATKRYKEAFKLALELFEKTKEYNYLAQAAIFEYEGAKKKEKKVLEDVAKKLEEALKYTSNPIYLNYLGYLYIEHNMDIKRGVELVKEALKKEPSSPYYLDSLAWGYYKMRKCKMALALIKRVYFELGFKDDEVKYHLEMIKKCNKEHR